MFAGSSARQPSSTRSPSLRYLPVLSIASLEPTRQPHLNADRQDGDTVLISSRQASTLPTLELRVGLPERYNGVCARVSSLHSVGKPCQWRADFDLDGAEIRRDRHDV
jgi:hypothetical protein